MTAMYLIDTDTLVYALNGHPQVVQHLEERAAEPKALSVITYGELLYGASLGGLFGHYRVLGCERLL